MYMTLKILLPHKVFLERKDVRRIIFESPEGAFGLLPKRLDCVSAVAPGILFFETTDNAGTYVATDKGMLVKTGSEVKVSVRNAFGGTDLGNLKSMIDKEFNNISEDEKKIRVSLAKLESNLIRQFNIMKEGK